MVALGNIGTEEAISLIEKECKMRKERSYIAAVQVLGDVGRETSISILQDIYETDETAWVRETAEESINKILKRIKH